LLSALRVLRPGGRVCGLLWQERRCAGAGGADCGPDEAMDAASCCMTRAVRFAAGRMRCGCTFATA
jgi:hypothetical protein